MSINIISVNIETLNNNYSERIAELNTFEKALAKINETIGPLRTEIEQLNLSLQVTSEDFKPVLEGRLSYLKATLATKEQEFKGFEKQIAALRKTTELLYRYFRVYMEFSQYTANLTNRS